MAKESGEPERRRAREDVDLMAKDGMALPKSRLGFLLFAVIIYEGRGGERRGEGDGGGEAYRGSKGGGKYRRKDKEERLN